MSDQGQSRRDVEAVLQARAEVLAQSQEVQETATTAQYATFSYGGTTFGVRMSDVLRAQSLRHITEVPRSPPYLVGLAAVEGQLLSLLDPVTFFELPRGRVGDVSGALVVSNGKRVIGLAAEELMGMEAAVGAPTPVASGKMGPGIAGWLSTDDGELRMLALDVHALLQDPRLKGA